MKDINTQLNQWKAEGKYADINGHKIFYRDIGPSDAVPLLFLHGYPTSSYDYYKVVDRLAQDYRLILHDHVGFGFSDKPDDYSYSLKDQAQIALNFWRHNGISKCHIIAHDYGTSVLTEILALRELDKESVPQIERIILTNGSVHIELAQLRLIQKLLLNKITGPIVTRFVNKSIFIKNMKKMWFDKSKISDRELSEMWNLVSYNKGNLQFHKITQYIRERYIYWDRWVGALTRLDIPCLILWAENDPVAVGAIAEQLHAEIPINTLHYLSDTGHFPMLERPEEWSRAVLEFLS